MSNRHESQKEKRILLYDEIKKFLFTGRLGVKLAGFEQFRLESVRNFIIHTGNMVKNDSLVNLYINLT